MQAKCRWRVPCTSSRTPPAASCYPRLHSDQNYKATFIYTLNPTELLRKKSSAMSQIQDVVIIGGGAAGCAVSYYLAKAGVKSTVIERDGIAANASGYSAGGLNPLEGAGIPGPLGPLAIRVLPDARRDRARTDRTFGRGLRLQGHILRPRRIRRVRNGRDADNLRHFRVGRRRLQRRVARCLSAKGA